MVDAALTSGAFPESWCIGGGGLGLFVDAAKALRGLGQGFVTMRSVNRGRLDRKRRKPWLRKNK